MPEEDSNESAQRRVGTVLAGKWRLIRPIGCGGTAWVFAGAGPTGTLAAVKILHASFAAYPEIVARFIREAAVAKRIDHPGVVHIFDEGTCDDNVPFMVMEFLDGETLEERRARKGGKLPLEEVMWATDQVLSILAAAHKHQIVHRDIKPENVFLTRQNEIKLLDFGIARMKGQGGSSNENATKVGSMLGSLHYMPPEQGRGDWTNVGVQTDLWAVGATMFALLAGRPVHDEEDILSQLQAVTLTPAPHLHKFAPEVPDSVATLVGQALQFDANKRWSDAATMQLALRIAHQTRDNNPPSSDELDPESIREVARPRIFSPPTVPPFSRRPRGG